MSGTKPNRHRQPRSHGQHPTTNDVGANLGHNHPNTAPTIPNNMPALRARVNAHSHVNRPAGYDSLSALRGQRSAAFR
jgi:hypothetical protein